jgi:hypothetical protein
MKHTLTLVFMILAAYGAFAVGTPEEPEPEPKMVELARTSYAYLPPGYNPRMVNSAGPMLLGQWGDVRFEKQEEGLNWEMNTSLRYNGPSRERKVGDALLLWQDFFLLRPSDRRGGEPLVVRVEDREITKSAPGLLFSLGVNRALKLTEAQRGILLFEEVLREEEGFTFTFRLGE